MATATIETNETEYDHCVALHGVDWKGYSTLLRLRGERSAPKIVYLDGTVWFMSPAFPHERLKNRLGQLVAEIVVGTRDPVRHRWIDDASRAGQNAAESKGTRPITWPTRSRIRGKQKIHLRTDPPPDLAIEAVYLHEADAAVEVYRRFKVPEVWVCDEAGLVILVLQSNGRYAESCD